MKRRELIRLFGLAATWPLASRAQGTMPVVGYMSGRAPEESEHLTAAFRDGLSETGFVEGKNVTVEYRWAFGNYDNCSYIRTIKMRTGLRVL